MDVRLVTGARVRARWGGRPSGWDVASWLAVVAVAAALVIARPLAPRPATAAQPALAPATQLSQGSTAMATAISKGFDFTVVSRSTLYAKPGGPKIQVPDPADPYLVAGTADSYYLGASAATGTVSPSGYAIQMYGGETDPSADVDIAKLQPTLAGLVVGGKSWRNDGAGWYATDRIPGIGLDPDTIRLLPALLSHATNAAAKAPTVVGGVQLPTVAAQARVADAPGLMAVDAATFTELAQPLTFSFDAQGRLAQVTATMRNTRVADFDLLVVATVTFDYGHVSALPAPSPLAPLPATPAPDPTTTAAKPGA